jgi:SAM-dependent methyltransferase
MHDQQQAVTTYFDADPKGYVSSYVGETAVGYSFRVRRERLLEMLGEGVGEVLDIGCGPGVMTEEILARGWKWTGIDIAPKMIETTLERFGSDPRVKALVGGVEHIPVESNRFDVVVAMGLVEYLADDVAVVREMARVLKPGGRLFVSLPNWWSPVRMWDRWIIRPLTVAARVFGRHGGRAGVYSAEYRSADYCALLAREGLESVRTVAYNMRVLPRPFDFWLPRLSVRIATTLEKMHRGPFWWLATGVIIEAKKKGE